MSKNYTKKGTEWGTNGPSSSSYINSTTTITLPESWEKIDYEKLKRINFGKAEIKNIYKKAGSFICPELIQDSINQFAYGLTHNPERYQKMRAPAGILVSKLSEGIRWEENGYLSPDEILKKEKETKTLKMLEELKEPKFTEWFSNLNDKEKEDLVHDRMKSSPSYIISKFQIQKQEGLRYFEQTLWPAMVEKLKSEIIL